MTSYNSPYGHPQPGKTVADATALAAIAAADRYDGEVLLMADGSRWRFSAGSSATAVSGHVIAPAAGTGRWLRLADSVESGFELAYDHAQATGDTTVKLLKASRAMVIDSVDYINPTGLAEDASNYFDVQVLKGSVVAASKNTKTGEGGTLAADTFVALTPALLANRTVAAGDIISLKLDETGTATLPAGRVVIHGRYV